MEIKNFYDENVTLDEIIEMYQNGCIAYMTYQDGLKAVFHLLHCLEAHEDEFLNKDGQRAQLLRGIYYALQKKTFTKF